MVGDGTWIAPQFWVLLTIVLGGFSVWVSSKYIGGLIDTVTKLKEEVIRLGEQVKSLQTDIVDLKDDYAEIKKLFYKRP